jgi:hypothetical protein
LLHVDPALTARHLEDPKFAEQFTVWALRAWVHNSQRPSAAAVEIETGFRLAKIEPALSSITFFMRVLQAASQRQIEVRCTSRRWQPTRCYPRSRSTSST